MQILEALKKEIQGEVQVDNIYRTLYATDASAYRENPKAVVFPKNKED